VAKKSHPDVEFHVLDDQGQDRYFRTFDEAALVVFYGALRDDRWRNLQVLVRSEAGAKWWGGEDAVERFRSDPDASIFEQLKVKVNSEGMIA